MKESRYHECWRISDQAEFIMKRIRDDDVQDWYIYPKPINTQLPMVPKEVKFLDTSDR